MRYSFVNSSGFYYAIVPTFLAVKKCGGIHLVNIDEVNHIKGAGVYTEIFLTNGEKELHDMINR